MPRYGVFQDGGRYDDLGTLCEAIGLAEELMGGIPVGECSTFTVERDGRLLASVTNRRITGTFHKEYWSAREEAVECEALEFDATGHVLRMAGGELRALRDNRDSSDAVGQAHVAWNGPFRVTLVESVCEFFGVDDVADITDEALAFARWRWYEEAPVKACVHLTVALQVRVAAVASLAEFVGRLDWGFHSRTVGVSVTDAEILGAEQPGDPDAAALSEDEIADFLCRRIENGELAAEDIPVRLARYGLMQPLAFVEEMRERMASEKGG